MGIFGKDININVKSDVVSNDNQAQAEIHVVTGSTIRQQRKFAKENYKRDLDKHYRELAFAKYDANDPKQIVDTMIQLAAFINAINIYAYQQNSRRPYLTSASTNLRTGIALLKSVDPSNPMIAHFEGVVAFIDKQTKQMLISFAFVGILIVLAALLPFILLA